jgi:hypothetical protein
MPWFLVDDGFAFHRKVVAAGNAALGLWVRAGSWCARELTDGFVPDHMLTALGTRPQAKRLVAVGLWERVDGGYRFWQWNDPGRQPTRNQVEQKRAAARERMRKVRGSREQDENEHSNNARSSDAVRDAFPSLPSPSLQEGSLRDHLSRRNARPDLDDDLAKQIDEQIIEVLRDQTGLTVTADWAAKTRRLILGKRTNVTEPERYVLTAIEREPERFLPIGRDPASQSATDAIAATMRAARGEP